MDYKGKLTGAQIDALPGEIAKKANKTELCYTFNKNGTGAQTAYAEANGKLSTAEGEGLAGGEYAHAEGQGVADGAISHAEGSGETTAEAKYAHAEGLSTQAKGENSHTEGSQTITTNANEHAQGKYNKSTSGVTLHSVGIGYETTIGSITQYTRKNAEEITAEGKKYILGVGGYDGTNVTSESVKDVASVITEISKSVSGVETLLSNI